MTAHPQRTGDARRRTTLRFSARLGWRGVDGEGSADTEGGDQGEVVTAIALAIGVGVSVVPGAGLGVLCLLLPGVPNWLAIGLPLAVWVATTAGVLLRLHRR
nr:hypothetical protein GCM10020063_026810 [Dactylosporangium thailandense]